MCPGHDDDYAESELAATLAPMNAGSGANITVADILAGIANGTIDQNHVSEYLASKGANPSEITGLVQQAMGSPQWGQLAAAKQPGVPTTPVEQLGQTIQAVNTISADQKAADTTAQDRVTAEDAARKARRDEMLGGLATQSKSIWDEIDALKGQSTGYQNEYDQYKNQYGDETSAPYQQTLNDRSAYGQAASDIGRQYDQSEGDLASALQARGMTGVNGGTAQGAFGNLYGGKAQALGKMQQDMATARIANANQTLSKKMDNALKLKDMAITKGKNLYDTGTALNKNIAEAGHYSNEELETLYKTLGIQTNVAKGEADTSTTGQQIITGQEDSQAKAANQTLGITTQAATSDKDRAAKAASEAAAAAAAAKASEFDPLSDLIAPVATTLGGAFLGPVGAAVGGGLGNLASGLMKPKPKPEDPLPGGTTSNSSTTPDYLK